MGTYYINPNGLAQKDLVALLKDVETAMGGTNSTDSITIPVTVDTTGTADGMSVAKSVITAGSIWESAVSVAVNSAYAIGYNDSYAFSAAKSQATSVVTAQATVSSAFSGYRTTDKSTALSYTTSMADTGESVINSVMSAGSILASGISVAVQSGTTGGLMSVLSRLDSKATVDNSTDKSTALSYSTSMVDVAGSVINSVMAAGSIMASGISVAAQSGTTGGFMSVLSRLDSRCTAHSF